MFLNNERYIDMLHMSLSQQFKQNAMICCFLVSVCSMTIPEIMQPVIPWNRFSI